MDVYVAFNSVPDYTSPAPSFHSVHTTLESAAKALYPKEGLACFQPSSARPAGTVWNGPNGFGMIRRVEMQEAQYYIQLRLRPTKIRGKEGTEKIMEAVIEYLLQGTANLEVIESEVYQ